MADVYRTGTADLGNGFFKPNISTMVGRLYTADDKRKDSAFTIFYMGVNVGSTLAPLICGLVGNTGHPEDFKWGFLAACIGMVLGAAVFQIFKNKYICDPDGNPVGTVPSKADCNTQKASQTGKESNKRTNMDGCGNCFTYHSVFCKLEWQWWYLCWSRLDWLTYLCYDYRYAHHHHYRQESEPYRTSPNRCNIHHRFLRDIFLGSLRTGRSFTYLLC